MTNHNTPPRLHRRLLAGMVVLCLVATAWGDTSAEKASVLQSEAASPLSSKEHPWGHFLPGSWGRTQTTTWTVHGGKRVRSVSETKTTLESIDKIGLTLKEEQTTIDTGGANIQTAPVTKRFDFFGIPINESLRVSAGEPTKLVIGNIIVPCELRLYELESPAGRRKTAVWYSRQIYPYVLRVERIHRSLPTEKTPEERVLSQSTMEVLDTFAFQLRKSKLGTYRTRTIRKSGPLTTVTESFCSRHLPGGLLRETSRELDAAGSEIRTVESRLINYHALLPGHAAEGPAWVPDDRVLPSEKIRPRRRRLDGPSL